MKKRLLLGLALLSGSLVLPARAAVMDSIAEVDSIIDAAVERAVDSAVDKAVTEGKAHKFFSDLWNQFGFGIDARIDLQFSKSRADEYETRFNIQSLKLVFDGKVLPQVRYYVKVRLTS